MKYTKVLTVALLALASTQLWAQQAVTPQLSAAPTLAPAAPAFQSAVTVLGNIDLYKVEAMKLLITPVMRESAARLTDDPILRERIELAMAIDPLFYDGLRLVRSRGVITGEYNLDDLTVYRAVKAFSVTPREASAWLMASRLMQLGEFKNDGIALTIVEESVMHTGSELFCEMRARFGFEGACKIMPRLAVTLGYAVEREHHCCWMHHHPIFGLYGDRYEDREFRDRELVRWNYRYAGMYCVDADLDDAHGPAVGHSAEY